MGSRKPVLVGVIALLLAAALQAANTVPVITSISPTATVAGSPTFTLDVFGNNFVTGAQVRVNNVARTTQFISATHLTTSIQASDVSAPGSLQISATNPGTAASSSVSLQVQSNVPSISSLTPSTVAVNGPSFMLSVTGQGYATNAVVRVNNNARTTTFVDTNHLTAIIPGTDLTTARTLSITVFNPTPINQVSTPASVIVTNTPAPSITLISPTSVVAGSPGFTLFISGMNFFNNSVVRINTLMHPSSFVDGSHITVPIGASEITTASTLNITVTNPSSNLISSPIALTVTAGNIPAILSITPTSVVAGSNPFTLAITGTNFTSTSIVRFNGGDRVTHFVDDKHLTAAIQAMDVANEGTGAISVFNPPPMGGTSSTVTLTIFSKNAPIITSLSPATFPTGSPSLRLTVIGSKFLLSDNDVVLIDDSPRTTEFVDANTLVATLLSDDVAVAGTHTVTVTNKNGFTSAPFNFNVADQAGPVVGTIDPSLVAVGAPPFTLKLTGMNFVDQSVVTIDGTPRTTTFVSPTQLTVLIFASDLSTPRQMSIVVVNPDGASSVAVNLTVALIAPVITGLNPSQLPAGSPGFILEISGTGFSDSSIVNVNGVTKTASFDSATGKLFVSIAADDISAPGNLAVSVTGTGGTSAVFNLLLVRPVITSVAPTMIPLGTNGAVLTIQGTNFLATSKVLFLGTARDAVYNSANQTLTVTLGASDLTTAGQFGVVVQNSLDALSAPFVITVGSPGDPRIDALAPSTFTAGTASSALTVTGANFQNGAVVLVNGAARSTQFVSTSELTATLTAADLASSGTLSISVRNPDNATSGAVTLTIASPSAPQIDTISPSPIAVGTPFATLTVTGSNFVDGSVVRVNESARSTQFISSTQLTATLTSADLGTAGTLSVSVRNPDGSISNAATLTISSQGPQPPSGHRRAARH
jgi:hypothetical protein